MVHRRYGCALGIGYALLAVGCGRVGYDLDGDSNKLDGDSNTDSGAVVLCSAPEDCPGAGDECAMRICDNGTCGQAFEPLDTTCSAGGTVCDGAGACVECNTAGQCGGPAECQIATCTANTCGSANLPDGASCDDGQFCNGTETCAEGLCGIPGTGDPCPGPDGDADCQESCDEVGDNCSADDPVGAPCSLGTCSVGGSCDP